MRIATVSLLVLLFTVSIAMAAVEAPAGPAPNSGDGVSDGSGLEPPAGDDANSDAFGPAPNAGDGTSDGSGLDAPAVGRS